MKTDSPNCYKCKHKGDVAGSRHSSCKHPSIGVIDAMEGMMAIFASVGRAAPVINSSAKDLNIKGSDQGIRGGWFNWPHNFDPVWLESCNGFEAA